MEGDEVNPAAGNEGRPPDLVVMGRYEMGKLLGCGAFAKVYHARDTRTGQSVAIKVMNKQKIAKAGIVPQIKREISIMRRLRHPNIVRLLEVTATKTQVYFVMEFVKGGDLFDRILQGRLREDVARRYFQQLISAVRYFHSRGVYHRDLKLENVLLEDDRTIKVSDFGLSAVSEKIQQDERFDTLCGTPAYVAPEVLAKKGYNGRQVDVWSCGIILFVLSVGYLPFNDPNLMVMYRKIYKGEFRCPRWLSPDLRRLICRMLDTNPETRINTDQILADRWFRREGFQEAQFTFVDEDEDNSRRWSWPVKNDNFSSSPCLAGDGDQKEGRLPRPMSLNAFDIIQFSPGMDLTGLFEESGKRPDEMFLSRQPASTIIEKLEEIAKMVAFKARKKNFRIELEGMTYDSHLALDAEIFQLADSLLMVVVRKRSGHAGVYEDFCSQKLRPTLSHIVYEFPTPSSESK